MRRRKKPPKPKAVNFQFIPPDDKGHTPEPYKLLSEVRAKWHEELAEAKIALAWRISLKADLDGHLMLGKCMKASDLSKEFAAWDFIILLNKEVWNCGEWPNTFTTEKKIALLDHELCHAAPVVKKETGEPSYDERGRRIWRTVKHDIEEFTAVVSRHGTYKKDLEAFAKALLTKSAKPPLLKEIDKKTEVPAGVLKPEKSAGKSTEAGAD